MKWQYKDEKPFGKKLMMYSGDIMFIRVPRLSYQALRVSEFKIFANVSISCATNEYQILYWAAGSLPVVPIDSYSHKLMLTTYMYIM